MLDRGGERWAVEEIDRLNRTADMIQAKRRVLVGRIARKIETQSLFVVDVAEWIRHVAG